MRLSILSVILAGAVLVLSATAGAHAHAEDKPFDHARLARRALEAHIVPSYARLGEATKALEDALRTACRAPAAAVPAAVASAYDRVVSRWGEVEHLGFGPAVVDNRGNRFFFFPDRRGIGARQVAKALAARDAALLDPAALGGSSVGLQSLSALDVVLFDPARKSIKDAAALDYRCRYALAIAGNLDRIARDILSEWSQPERYRKTWLAPGPGNAAYRNATETTMTLAKALLQGLERVRDERVGGPLSFGKTRRRMPAALQTSGRSLRLVAGNIDGLIDLYRNGGIEEAVRETFPPDPQDGRTARANLVEAEMKTARGIVLKLIGVPRPFDDKSTVSRLIAMGFPLKNARDQASGLLTEAAGLTLGFNASDGD